MALSQNIEEIYVVVLDITQYELVPAYYIWALQEMG